MDAIQVRGSKKARSVGTFSGNTSMGGSVGVSQGQQVPKPSNSAPSVSSGVRPPRSNNNRGVCPNCRKVHVGPCNESLRCYHCQQVGHIRRNCPRLAREGGGFRPSYNQGALPRTTQPKDVTQPIPSHPRTPTGSNTLNPSVSRPQPQAQTRIYAMTQEDANQNPKTIEGNS